MSLVKSSKLQLYKSQEEKSPFEISTSSTDIKFVNPYGNFKFDQALEYKSGLVYQNVGSNFTALNTYNAAFLETFTTNVNYLNARIDFENARALTAEALVQTHLDTEAKTRGDVDTLFQTASALEVTNRTNADTTLTTNLNFEIARAQAQEGVITALVSSEATAARAAELVLRNDLATEVAARVAVVAAEVKARGDQDVILSALIASEQATRIADDLTIATNASNDTIAEAKTARAAELALSNRISFMLANVDVKAMDSLSEIVNKINAVGADLYVRVATIEAALESLRGASLYAVAQAAFVAGVVPE